ncbi:Multiple inositol polyphosphate phosphatase 1 [Araneus ventricosus]|uniref:Multiple inositol polyphosphate phosphatase 1 n=1 Tax=Araneus ventricosus TaxID=182803 RepID=A0A4Y2FCN1_ARAVE|nr:Multiple inositol polyphosphate phosphatase 1 [Araneus ventricosus]
MNPVIESNFLYRRRSHHRLPLRDNDARNVLNERVIDGVGSLRRFLFSGGWTRTLVATLFYVHEFIKMHKSTRTGLIGLTILACLIVIILIANLVSISTKDEQPLCVKLDGGNTCHSKDPDPYRYYGTKTPYRIAIKNNNESDLPLEGCTPILFYMLSRHATRYPDEEYIVDLIKLLPALKKNITDSFLAGKAKICKEDLEKIKKFELNMKKEDDNRISATGAVEAQNLGHRLKRKFSPILDDKYSPEKFLIEYTSRDRTKVTAENFAKGLFGDDDYKNIDFEGKVNDGLLNFHKTCKKFRKKCEDPSYDVSEIDSFQNGALMKSVVKSVSERIGVNVTSGDIKLLYIACVFGYALNNSDAWCSVFSRDDLRVLEFNDDIDDYYKDAYGNDVNYEQACPIARYIFNLFKSGENANDTKVVLHFSHAGAIKKVYAMFGLFRDELPLTADAFCSEQNRKWRSSLIAPFNTNIELVLYHCGDEYKVATFHNEKPVKVNGCDNELCSFNKFSATYEPMSKACNISKICCTCCKE